MNNVKKVFLLNVTLLSILLSIGFSLGFIKLISNENDYIGSLGGAPEFFLLFLILYPFHILISAIHFLMFRFFGNSFYPKLALFNLIGLGAVVLISYFLDNFAALYLFISFVIFSLVTVLVNQSKPTLNN